MKQKSRGKLKCLGYYSRNFYPYFEHLVDLGYASVLLIFGHHARGAFIAIPDLSVSVEATDYPNEDYSYYRLVNVGMDEEMARSIAHYVSAWQKKRIMDNTFDDRD